MILVYAHPQIKKIISFCRVVFIPFLKAAVSRKLQSQAKAVNIPLRISTCIPQQYSLFLIIHSSEDNS